MSKASKAELLQAAALDINYHVRLAETALDTQHHVRPAESSASALVLVGLQVAFLFIIASQHQIGGRDAGSSCLPPGRHGLLDGIVPASGRSYCSGACAMSTPLCRKPSLLVIQGALTDM